MRAQIEDAARANSGLLRRFHKGNRNPEVLFRAENVSPTRLPKATVLHDAHVAAADRQSGKVWPILRVWHRYAKSSFKCSRTGKDNRARARLEDCTIRTFPHTIRSGNRANIVSEVLRRFARYPHIPNKRRPVGVVKVLRLFVVLGPVVLAGKEKPTFTSPPSGILAIREKSYGA